MDHVRTATGTPTNLMLELVRLRLNRLGDPSRYAQAIREHLAAKDGELPQQGLIRDPRGVYVLSVERDRRRDALADDRDCCRQACSAVSLGAR